MNQKLRGIKIIFFDAGGTLLNLDAERICGELRDKLDIHADSTLFHRAQCLTMFQISQLVGAGKRSTEEVKREFFTVLKRELGIDEEKIVQAVETTLELSHTEMLWRATAATNRAILWQLKERGFRLAIVSNSDGRDAEGFAYAGLSDLFEFIIDSFDVGVEKPNPRIFQIALERAEVNARQAVYIGDLYSVDVVGARGAGVVPILYDPYRLNADKDCLRIQEMEELFEILA